MTTNELIVKLLEATPDEQAAIAVYLTRESNVEKPEKSALVGAVMDQAKKALGVPAPTVWRMIQDGRLKQVEILPGSYLVVREVPVTTRTSAEGK
ncbi:MAG: hypothetical protein WCO56_24885 [Verrucomicrobiota bacterium]